MLNVQYMKEGETFPVLFFAVSLPRYKIIQMLLRVGYIFSLLLFLWQAYLMLIHFKAQYFVQYAPISLITLATAISIRVFHKHYNTYRHHVRHLKETFFWHPHMMSSKTQTLLKQDALRIRWTYGMLVLGGFIVALNAMFLWIRDYENYCAVSALLAKYVPEHAKLIHYSLAPFAILGFFPLTASPWYSLYMLLYFKNQLHMLADSIRILSCTEETGSSIIETNTNHHRIKCYLKFFVKRHEDIISFMHFMKEKGEILNLSFIVASLLISLTTVFRIFSPIVTLESKALFTGVYFAYLLAIAYECQLVEDKVAEMSAKFNNLKWYAWDHENMKTFMVISLYVSKTRIFLPLPSFFEANLNVVKTMSKFWYTVANYYHTMMKTK